MKCISDPNATSAASKIQVRDGKGQIWEIEASDVQYRTTRYSDDQGPDDVVTHNVPSAVCPDGTILLLPLPGAWRENVVYDGVLRSTIGSYRWEGLTGKTISRGVSPRNGAD